MRVRMNDKEIKEFDDFNFDDFKLDHIFSEEVTGTWKGQYVALNKKDYQKLLPKKKISKKTLDMLLKLKDGAKKAKIEVGFSYNVDAQDIATFNEINYAYEEVLNKLGKLSRLVDEVEKTHEVVD